MLTRNQPMNPAPPVTMTRFGTTEALDFMANARDFGIETEARALIDQNTRGEISVEAARSAILSRAADQQRARTANVPLGIGGVVPAGSGARITGDERDSVRVGMEDALFSRMTGSKPSDQGAAISRHGHSVDVPGLVATGG